LSYGRGAGVERARGVGVTLGVRLAVAVGLGVIVGVADAVAVTDGVAVGVVPCPQYLPPVSKKSNPPGVPPQAIISLPVHTAV